jgi:hypothetical protein
VASILHLAQDAVSGTAAYGQRVWKWQPGGGLSGLGTSPCTTRFSRRTRGSGTGTAFSSASVYGCSGRRNSDTLSVYSTMRPRYITATRWLMCSTTARLCEMNRYDRLQIALQLHQQIDDLRLNRHIQRRHRLVAHDQPGIERQRTRDPDALALPARELVRIGIHLRRAQPDPAKQLRHAFAPLFLGVRRRGCASVRQRCRPPACADSATKTDPGK